MQDFLLNTWYMVAWPHEISTNLLSRKLLGKAVLLTRDGDGKPVVMRDRCPHRFARLSMGERKAESIVCKYHGLEFNFLGQCVNNPYSDRIPSGATVARHPAVEKDGIVWAWFGDPEQADENLIPDFSAADAPPGGSYITGYTPLKANYEYGTDNLLDLSHIEFLHTGTFAGNGVIFGGEHSVKQDGDRLMSNWWMPNARCPAGLDQILQLETVDHWLDMRWNAPANMHLQIGATPPGQPREQGATFEQVHCLTPADVDETHYFWSTNSQYPQPEEYAETFRELVRAAFEIEDKPMIEAAYENIGDDFWSEKPVSLGIDAGGARARRIIEVMKRKEAEVVS
ncbi:aromatic ring-hydroxylating dioxygenase subunit alpha [Aurantiacibacter poecillastricola]|uniref:aromatic ring-hydroxylating dioxygenase subunit alpha n=1 Tax=Aurantiacibacter poecillastricola TaxID=3064385 RepID=UPI00273F5F1C|nr:aromatic ring-hydroxylating dioxygenase subunit alpha [Aurantiacibacter sp. 219JJ12-13]MDP5261247.1 aromatic ring-hydroxylating dioxygenase subunit alpha [Aurantiacibacter sp. 219JJ12-13]